MFVKIIKNNIQIIKGLYKWSNDVLLALKVYVLTLQGLEGHLFAWTFKHVLEKPRAKYKQLWDQLLELISNYKSITTRTH